MTTQTMTTIARYMTNRIKTTADWYQKKSALENPCVLTHTDETLFDVLMFVVMQKLQEGHTVLVLEDMPLANSTLRSWQWHILSPLVAVIEDKLPQLSLVKLFERIDELKGDMSALLVFIDEIKQSVIMSYRQQKVLSLQANAQFHQQMADETWLSDSVLSALRFYYYSTHGLLQSLERFANKISEQYFFADSMVANRPLVGRYDSQNKVLYVWLNRSYHAEYALLNSIHQLLCTTVTPIELSLYQFGGKQTLNKEQVLAANHVANHPLTLITGGPGTGKTFTLAHIVIAMFVHGNYPIERLALSAPTGKAAQRMQESLKQALLGINVDLPAPMTLHRLLGIGVASTPRYHADNPLPYDMIIVDEASMLGIELAQQLFLAIRQGTRVVLLGDVHQLAAVEAGAVLSDLCHLPNLKTARVQLQQSRRFTDDSGIGQLATLVNQSSHISLQAISSVIDCHDTLSWECLPSYVGYQHDMYQKLLLPYLVEYRCDQGYFQRTKSLKKVFYKLSQKEQHQQVVTLLAIFNQYRILTASHLSLCGDVAINAYIQAQHKEYLSLRPSASPWYHGRPVMVLKNLYQFGLFNGDIGICLQSGRSPNQLSVYFVSETVKSFSVGMLDNQMLTTAYAMTVHKSQGSEFEQVAIVFEESNQRLLCKELIYTAITRAKERVFLYTTPQAMMMAVNTPTVRQTGLGVIQSYDKTDAVSNCL